MSSERRRDARSQVDVGTETARDLCLPFIDRWGKYRTTRDPISENDIRRFCEMVEDGNPVYWDEQAAVASRFGRLIAPPQSLYAMTFGAWWTPNYVQTEIDAGTVGVNDDEDPAPVGTIFEICARFGYVVSTIVDQNVDYIAEFGPGDGRIVMRSKVSEVSSEKAVRVGKGVFLTSITEYQTEKKQRLIGRSTTVLLRYRPKE